MTTAARAPLLEPVAIRERPEVRGKFLFAGGRKLLVRGVTYGTFATDAAGRELLQPAVVEGDFAAMRAAGINAVRLYTAPARWLLDCAQQNGIYVMVGLPWEQHIAFLEDPVVFADIERRTRDAVRGCAGHPAVLCYAIGNEIPATIVRWHGAERVARALERLAAAVRREDPGALVTYVNYPTTEYLDLRFADIVCFNVYLEHRPAFESYLARLQNIAHDRPLVLAELGLDSRRAGEERQAATLNWLVRSSFRAGAAGTFVFAWTDDWWRGGYWVDDWDFGLTRRDRTAKPALEAVRTAFADAPFGAVDRPRASVVVCAYNAAATLRDCLDAALALDYPDYEVIVIDDGSTDATATIAEQYPVRLIRTPNRGLSNARNTGLDAATGEFVVYLDSDAYPDRDWLTFYAAAFASSTHAAIGGPNLAPPARTALAQAFDNAPGLPVQVLLSDTEAEHVPGCNMAFRRMALRALGGFDPDLRVAGDDVDLCWRLQDGGGTIGFCHGAMVWHHRRTTLRSYWKQQRGYGRAEALLQRKWPERYNAGGHVSWGGTIYTKPPAVPLFSRGRVYQGTWGTASYQSALRTPSALDALALVPEWYIVIAVLAAPAALGVLWHPLLWSLPFLAAAIAVPLLHALGAARRVRVSGLARGRDVLRVRAVVALLHLVQPLARLYGRIEFGLAPWRTVPNAPLRPFGRRSRLFSRRWRSHEQWLAAIEHALRDQGAGPVRNGPYDRWDLEIWPGLFGGARALVAIEEHGAGTQLLRLRASPRWSISGLVVAAVSGGLGAAAFIDHAIAPGVVLSAGALGVLARAALEVSSAVGAFEAALGRLRAEAEPA